CRDRTRSGDVDVVDVLRALERADALLAREVHEQCLACLCNRRGQRSLSRALRTVDEPTAPILRYVVGAVDFHSVNAQCHSRFSLSLSVSEGVAICQPRPTLALLHSHCRRHSIVEQFDEPQEVICLITLSPIECALRAVQDRVDPFGLCRPSVRRCAHCVPLCLPGWYLNCTTQCHTCAH